ncbi:hypothetical protein CICLE_v10022967mg [Citrus x clementina]|uniref:AAI domain-containing protein n=3 Tax=Citrus TaxID=2706 RepID=A0ACB8ME44_CITSI|nr:hypothetical protein CICLE_v10022967mg [Citrus x clementina]KAH9783900.1 AAI domain-containing protein [Citrus sinensis]
MGSLKKIIALVVKVIMVVGIGVGMSIGSSHAQGTVICNMTGAGLMACKPSVTPPNPTRPTTACCTALSHADLECFCKYKNSKLLPSLGIDPKLAMQLPDKCKLPHPANC